MTHSFPTRRSSDLSATRPGGTGLAQTPCARAWPPSAPRQVGIGREGAGGALGLTAGGRTDLHGNGGARGHCPDAPAHFCGKATRSSERESCRERVCQYVSISVVAASLKQQQ